ncbi:hypothetical protein L345_00646, partial [Ophiophagus hannah]
MPVRLTKAELDGLKVQFPVFLYTVLPSANSPIECGFPGLLSSFPKACPLKIANMSLSGAISHAYVTEFGFPYTIDEVNGSEANKSRKPKNTVLGLCSSRSIHAELAMRQAKSTSATMGSPRVTFGLELLFCFLFLFLEEDIVRGKQECHLEIIPMWILPMGIEIVKTKEIGKKR